MGISSQRLSSALTRREALRTLGIGAAMATIAACARGAPPAASSQPTAASGTPVPKLGGTLKVAIVGDLMALQAVHTGAATEWGRVGNVFDRLMVQDNQLQPQPALAESWDISSDGKQIKFNLRKGVQYHSGRDFVADDVVFTIQNLGSNITVADSSSFTSFKKFITQIQTPDKNTVIVTLDRPRVAMFDFFSYLNIVDSVSLSGANASTTAVGTGPFQFVEWVPADHFTLAKNKNYWRSGRPYLDQVIIQAAKDAQATAVALESGAVHIANPLAFSDVVRLTKDAKYKVLKGGLQQTLVALLNSTRPPTNNKKFRQGLSASLDRNRMVDQVFLGLGERRTLPWPPGTIAYDAAKNELDPFDLNRAKSLIADSGVNPTDLDCIFQPGIGHDITSQIWQSDLAQIGVKMNIKTLDMTTWVDQNNNPSTTSWNVSAQRYTQIEDAYTTLNGVTWGQGAGGFKNEQLAQLVDQAGSELDQDKRKAILSQVSDIILDECWALAIGATSAGTPVVSAATVNGISYAKGMRYEDVWLA